MGFRTETCATGAGGSKRLESYKGMELRLDDLHREVIRQFTHHQPRTSEVDMSRFCFRTRNDDIHLGAFHELNFRFQPDSPALHDTLERLRFPHSLTRHFSNQAFK